MKIFGLVSFLICIILMIVCIIKKYKLFKVIPMYIIPVFVLAIIYLISGISPINSVGDVLLTDNSVNPLKILILFLSMSFLSIYLDELGFFKYIASLALAKANNNQYKLFIKLYLLISVLTVFTSNDIIILTFTPFICFFCKHSKISPLPYLISEFIAANTWSMALIIGNPTNIYLGTYANIAFFDYLKVMILPTIGCGIVSFLVLLLVFNKQLKEPLNITSEVVKLKHKYLLADGIGFLIGCIILLSISNYINIEMAYIALFSMLLCLLSSLVMCIIKRGHYKYIIRALKRLPYEIIPFLISMFIIVIGLNNIGISESIASILNKFDPIFSYGIASTLFDNLMNNIPMSVLFASLSNNIGSIYASIIGSNLGAFLTPIGALAGILFISLTEKEDIHISYLTFTKYGIIILVPSLLTCLLILKIVIGG